jgi:hypothetical protein
MDVPTGEGRRPPDCVVRHEACSEGLAEVPRFDERSRAVFDAPGLRWGAVLMMMFAMTTFPMSDDRGAGEAWA